MQGKGLIKFFGIALIIVCLYQLSFTVASYRAEQKANNFVKERIQIPDAEAISGMFDGNTRLQIDYLDSLNREKNSIKRRFLDSIGNEVALNFLVEQYTYRDAAERQLSLGLDLRGGMSVILEISQPDLLRALSGYSSDENFERALNLAEERRFESNVDFVTTFGQAYEEVNPGGRLAAIFATPENQEIINITSSNQEVLNAINRESREKIRNTYNILRIRIDRFGVTQPNISLQELTGRITVELPGVDDPERVRRLLQSTAELNFWIAWDNADLIDFLFEANNVLAEIKKAERGDVEVDEADTISEPIITPVEDEVGINDEPVEPAEVEEDGDAGLFDGLGDIGDDGILDAQEDEDFALENPLFNILSPNLIPTQDGGQSIGDGPVIGYVNSFNKDQVMEYLNMDRVRAIFPRNVKFVWSALPIESEGQQIYELYALETTPGQDRPLLSGNVVVNAGQDFDQFGNAIVNMSMNREGSVRWRQITGDNVGKSIAIVLDDEVYSAPTIQGEISGGRTQITGRFDIREAQDLANILRAGQLPARAEIVEEEIVGPSLGQESINAGLQSLLIGLSLVFIFMILYYNIGGIISNIVLFLNLFFILGVLASLGAALTLPGIAGIVLTIGMAVDANVIIYERIREELIKGKGIKMAIKDGYYNSYSAIVDANLTTLITGFILLFFGLGPVQGFATVLVIGIFSSFFTAVLISRLIIEGLTNREKKVNFFNKYTEGAFKNLNYDFINKRKFTYILSGIIILLGITSMLTRGFELGVDFQGGRSYVVRFDQSVNTTELSTSLTDQFEAMPEVKTFGASNQVKITTAFMITDSRPEADSIVENLLFEGVKDFYDSEITYNEFINNFRMSSVKIGPNIADDIRQGAIWATVFSLVGIFLYILARFRRWQFSIGAIIAIFHDVLIMLSIFSIFKGILPFSMEIDQAFIAAILTIIGYSINDTVIVFDRIREYLILHPREKMDKTINLAINSTLSRTVITAITTLLVVVILFIFGGEVIRGFSFALLIGILVGTYSSIFIASPAVLDMIKKDNTVKK
ncbi:MAG: protein translocase subunit SecDF [Chitinophagaceae bacterium]|nr:MAG: protein translocase subunit SecDF [Chitinophagaceae bacterium]